MSYSPLNKSSSEKKVPDVKEKKNKKNRTQPKDKNAPGKNIEVSKLFFSFEFNFFITLRVLYQNDKKKRMVTSKLPSPSLSF